MVLCFAAPSLSQNDGEEKRNGQTIEEIEILAPQVGFAAGGANRARNGVA
ncbi:MAG: hypothetical protein WKF71_05210 [Pyrinomonadaceae bacterium]